MPDNLPDSADVVVIGAGAVGLATACHLAAREAGDVLVLERQQIASGTSWHAAGLVGSVRASEIFHQVVDRLYDFITEIESESGQQTGFRQVGSLWVAENEDRWAEIRRIHDQTRVWGPETRLLTIDELRTLYPLLDTTGLLGGMFAPDEGWISPVDYCQAAARTARKRGVRIIEHAPVDGVETASGRVVAVQVGAHRIRTPVVANCAGLWGREVGRMVGADVPLQAVEHYYAVTEKSDRIPRDLPVLRLQDRAAYVKEDAGALLVGSFERAAQPIAVDSLPGDFAFGELVGHAEECFLPVFEAATERLPLLTELGVRTIFCGPESFTPDGGPQIGAVDGVAGFFVCCGCNSQGLQASAGYGSALADWIVDGRAPCDLSGFDPRRNEPYANTTHHVRARATETPGLLYDNHYPYRQFATGRGVRRSPLHDLLRERGACFGQVAGWERPNWYAPEGEAAEYRYSFGRQNWFEFSAAEHRAFRTGVGLIDLSSFAAFEVAGGDACAALQPICSANIDVADGQMVYTHWLDDRAGIEADLTVLRVDRECFRVTTGPAVRRRDWDWLQRHLDRSLRVHATDLDSGTAIIGVFGPRARPLLEAASGVGLTGEACPPRQSLRMEIGAAPVRAVRVAFTGGDGWELHCGSGFAAHVFEQLERVGQEFDARLCGMHALDACRIERGFVHFGHEVSQDETPFHVGLGFVCAFQKGAFRGREAALAVKEAGVASLPRRMVSVLLEDPGPLLFGHEPLCRDGAPAGWVTSGGYGHALGAAVGLAWLRNPEGVSRDWVEAGRYTVMVEGAEVAARVSLRPFPLPEILPDTE